MGRRTRLVVLVAVGLLMASHCAHGALGKNDGKDKGKSKEENEFGINDQSGLAVPSAVKNFEFCETPDAEMFECLLPKAGWAMITPYMERSTEEEEIVPAPAAATLDESLPEPPPPSKGVKSDVFLKFVVRGKDMVLHTYTIAETYPDVMDLTANTLSYSVVGMTGEYDKLAGAVLAISSALEIPDQQLVFPVFECGTQWAVAVEVQGNNAGNVEPYTAETAGPDGLAATKNCLVHDKATAECYLRYYAATMPRTHTGEEEPIAMISRYSTSKDPSFAFDTLKRGAVTSGVFKPRDSGKLYDAYGDTSRLVRKGSFENGLLEAEKYFMRGENAMHFPDFNCGGRALYEGRIAVYRQKLAEIQIRQKTWAFTGRDFLDEEEQDDQEIELWDVPPSWKAEARGLVSANLISTVADSGQDAKKNDGKDIDPMTREKCTSFFSSRGIAVQEGTKMNVSFRSVKGNQSAKRAMMDNIVTPYIMGNTDTSRGVLQYGPPGTGKSLLAKALVSELTKAAAGMGRKDAVTYLPVTVTTFESMWKGESEQNVRQLFECARAYAPAVIFIDECDSVFSKRGSGSGAEHSSKVKGEFLVQMDGSFKSKSGDLVVVIGATNRPQALDSAFKRRLPVNVFVGLPVRQAREAIIESQLKKYMPVDYKQAEWWGPLLDQTRGYSGSDLVNMCKDAKTNAESHAMRAGVTSLPAKYKAILLHDETLMAKAQKYGPMSVAFDLNLSPEEAQNFIEECRKSVAASAMVATGLGLDDCGVLKDSLRRIQRSVNKQDMMELFKYMHSLGGTAVNDIPKPYLDEIEGRAERSAEERLDVDSGESEDDTSSDSGASSEVSEVSDEVFWRDAVAAAESLHWAEKYTPPPSNAQPER